MADTYTLAGLATHHEEIRKSRFVALADAVQAPDAALAFIDKHRVADASHHCWAYRIGQQYRFSDDGEPSGTAGRPILQAIDGQQCDCVVVLVRRWFGGIKLGAGGLTRAYGNTAAQCLRLAEKVLIVDEIFVTGECGFGDMARVRARLTAQGVRFVEEVFGSDGVSWRMAMPRGHADALSRMFADMTRGQGRWRPDAAAD
ncbi:DUF1949 domain-containing protein [Allopusillimonas soli]|uniref:YigZ family protein n=1 Tax=Allopusillimonas soli TaxID=659016 RepID=A0A853FAG9_9BURK|nr:YigZ family protein [Allopusillimonas soli]NYT36602.1 YigZ family protein [Allopusillimonas soli]TEA75091.1 DUF1949 domain-containing protein [Allopusillimonas soli]